MKKILVSVLALTAIATTAQAETSPFSYNYIQLGYINGDYKTGGSKLDFNETEFSGSLSLTDNFYLTASYSDGEIKVGPKADISGYSLGVGGRLPLGGATDFVGGISYAKSKVKFQGVTESESGYGISVGIRHLLSEQLELEAGVGIVDAGGDSDRVTSLSAGLRYRVAKGFSMGLGYGVLDSKEADANGFQLSLRAEF